MGVDDVAVLVESLARIGEAGAPSLAEVFGDLTEARRTTLVTHVAGLEAGLRESAAELERLTALRDEIAAERDDAPPLAATRQAARTERQGAALWQLVRFADGVSDDEAAAVEGALDAAGLLTSWIHPDPRLTAVALEQADPDAYLLSAPAERRPAGPTLSSILVPEEHDLVSAEVISEVLDSIALTDELTVASPAPAISRRGQFSSGVHLGAQPKTAPEYIGATYRAARRQARITEYERQARARSQERSDGEAERDALQRRLDDVGRARNELRPIAKGIPRAVAVLAEKSTLLAAGSGRVLRGRDRPGRRHGRDGRRAAPAPADGRGPEHARRHGGGRGGRPGDRRFRRAAEGLSQRLTGMETLGQDLAGRRRTIARLTAEHRGAAEALVEKEEAHLSAAERLAALEETLSAPLQEILGQISEAEQSLREAKATWQAEDERARREHDALVEAESAHKHGGISLLAALEELLDQLASFAPFAHADLRPVLKITAAPFWPDRTRWAGPEQIAAEIIERLSEQEAALAVRPFCRTAWPSSSASTTRPPRAGRRGRRRARAFATG